MAGRTASWSLVPPRERAEREARRKAREAKLAAETEHKHVQRLVDAGFTPEAAREAAAFVHQRLDEAHARTDAA